MAQAAWVAYRVSWRSAERILCKSQSFKYRLSKRDFVLTGGGWYRRSNALRP
jgi:hypothetical protein